MFGKDKQTLLGLDIGSATVKLVELSRNQHEYRLQACVIEPVPVGLVVDKQIHDVEALAALLKRMHRASKSRYTQVVTAIGGDNVITRVVSLPLGLNEAEFEEQAMLEAEQSLGVALDTVNVDFEILGPTLSGDRVEVLLAATRKDFIDHHQMAAQLAGLDLKIVDIEAFALENAQPFYQQQLPSGSGKTVALIDIGHTTTTVNLIHHGKSVGHQTQRFGCQQLHERLIQQSGMAEPEIFLHLQQGSLPSQYQSLCVEPFCQTAASQVSRLLQLMPGNGQVAELERVILSGGGALLTGMAATIETAIGQAAVVAQPLQGVQINPLLSQTRLRRHGASLVIALGLAMRGFES